MVRRPGGRTALYFMEPGEYPMPANVIYDREWTTFRATGIDDYDWDEILDTKVIFLTGITAALTDEAVKRGVEVILDVNFRRKLWSGEKAREVLEPIAGEATVLFCSIADAEKVFGITGTPEEVTAELQNRFGCKYVVSTTARTCAVAKASIPTAPRRSTSSTVRARAIPSCPPPSMVTCPATSARV